MYLQNPRSPACPSRSAHRSIKLTHAYNTYILALALEEIEALFEQLLAHQLGPLLQLLLDLACQLGLSFLHGFELSLDVANLLLILCACRYHLLRGLSAVVLLVTG